MQDTQSNALVIGYGASGASVRRYLERRGWRVSVTDRDPARAQFAGVAWCAPETVGAALADAALVVVSPGVPLASDLVADARERGIEIVGDIELFARAAAAPVVAVTGTNGKSTVATLVAAMAAADGRRVAAGGNLGTPALDLLAAEVELYVLELSSFQLELTTSLAPAAAAVLNLSPDHLDRHGSLGAYAAAKARIYEHAALAVANRDDALVMKMVHGRDAVVSFGLDAPQDGDYGLRERNGELLLCRGEETLLVANEVPLAGRHNLANVLAAWALGAALGLSDAAMAKAVRGFHALPHRLAPVGEHRGVCYLDDSKATNVSAACAALAGLEGPLVVIAGGQGKGQDFAEFAELLSARARAVVLIGADAGLIERAIDGRVPVVRAAGMSDAVGMAAALAETGDQVVLAPACASLDMFRDYNERGDIFTRAVEALDGD
ncbi:MAG: UDP-N-acetylmuramoyl-L-alanine--D-glutamate ligase [Gammaproteobacteria bacterium]